MTDFENTENTEQTDQTGEGKEEVSGEKLYSKEELEQIKSKETSLVLRQEGLDPVGLLFNKMSTVEEAFRSIFGDSVHIITKSVKVGGTSNNIYVPRKYQDNPVTIIIWPKIPEVNDKGEKIEK